MKDSKQSRRNFLKASAASFLGYSLIVKAPQTLAQTTLPSDKNSARISAITPDANAVFAPDEKLMKRTDIKCDVLVAGGGLSGIAAALSAARKGKKTVLIQDRSRLGGNASSEVRMHPLGVYSPAIGWREGGIMEELKLANAAQNPQVSWEMWDLVMYDKCVTEPNLTLILDTSVFRTEVENGKIKAAWARSDTARNMYRIEAEIYIDSTGDSRLAMESGAEVMSGRDGSKKYGEPLGDFDKIGTRQGSSLMITMRKHDRPMPFTAPSWAKKMTHDMMKYRGIRGDGLFYGYWWIELGGLYDAIGDNEMLRFELLAIVMGVWDYIKNSGKFPEAENIALESIGMVPGRRDTFRIVGERILKQQDVQGGWKDFDDGVAVGGWSLDDHPAGGFYASDSSPSRHVNVPPYNIPFSVMYSKDIPNLMMAGRNISCSHVAFTSTRVMSTCCAVGQAVGTAAAICIDAGITPSKLRATPKMLKHLQQELLKNDQTILGISNQDPLDLARKAKATASSSACNSAPENVLTGITLDSPKSNKNRWLAEASTKPWIKLDWATPQKISEIRLTFEPGWEQLAQSGSNYVVSRMHKGPQPMLVRDYNVVGVLPDGTEKQLVSAKGNYQKLVVHKIEPEVLKSVRLDVLATNGDKYAIVKEIRAY